VFQD
ncbi:hypothetical protein CISIN_1g0354011mg, partial [Citrus sinensis]